MIYFECYSDQAFLTSLGIPAKNLDHSFNKGNVCNKLQKSVNAIGLADEDPNEAQPRFIRELIQAKRIIHEDVHLILFLDTQTNNRLIIIRPNIEAWAIRLAKDLKIKLEDFTLANDEFKLHAQLGFAKNQRKLESFKMFFKEASKHPAILKVREFIS